MMQRIFAESVGFVLAALVIAGCSTPSGSTATAPKPNTRQAAVAARKAPRTPFLQRPRSPLPSWLLSASSAPNDDGRVPPSPLMAQDGPFEPPFAARIPLMRRLSGPILANPVVVPVVYSSDPLASMLIDFTNKLVASNYWTTTTSEYGVGRATAGAPVVLTEAPPTNTNVNDIVANLTAALTTPDPRYPVPTNDTIFELFFPDTTTIIDQGAPSCVAWGGFHAPLTLPNGVSPSYAMLPRCNDYGPQKLPEDQFATVAASHEVAESATDPQINATYGWADVNFAATAWAFAIGAQPGSEIGDMCQLQPHLTTTADVGYSVQRLYSNASARAGHDPCVPGPSGPYFNAMPIVSGTEVFVFPEQYLQGISLQPGQQTTIELRLFSDAPTAPWTLSAFEISGPHFDLDPDNLLRFAFDDDTGRNGDVRHLTVSVAEPPDGGFFSGMATFQIVSTLGTRQNTWQMVVGQ